MTDERPQPGGRSYFLVMLVIALAMGVASAVYTANAPAAKRARELRQAETRAELRCVAAGCPAICRRQGYC